MNTIMQMIKIHPVSDDILYMNTLNRMKKGHALILLILVFYTSVACGQTDKMNIGVEFGAGLTSLRGNKILEELNDATIGYSVGPAFQYSFTNWISVRTNVAFEKKGAVANSPAVDDFGSYRGEIKIHSNFYYLTIPVLARFTFGNTTKLFANIGPSFGYLIKQKTVTDAFAEYTKNVMDETDMFRRTDIGLICGIGAERPINEWLSLSVEIRNSRGLKNISKIALFNDGSIKTNSLNFLIGASYKFGNNQ